MADKLNKLQLLVDSFDRNLGYMKATKNKYNETSCRNEFIDPFLEILGWDVTNKKGVGVSKILVNRIMNTWNSIPRT